MSTVSNINQNQRPGFSTNSASGQKRPGFNPKQGRRVAHQQTPTNSSKRRTQALNRQLSMKSGSAVNVTNNKSVVAPKKRASTNPLFLCRKIVIFLNGSFLKEIQMDEKNELKAQKKKSKKIADDHAKCLQKQSESLANNSKKNLAVVFVPLVASSAGHAGVSFINSKCHDAITRLVANTIVGNNVVGMGNVQAVDQALEPQKIIVKQIDVLSEGLGKYAVIHLENLKQSEDAATQAKGIAYTQQGQIATSDLNNKHEEDTKHTEATKEAVRDGFRGLMTQSSRMFNVG